MGDIREKMDTFVDSVMNSVRGGQTQISKAGALFGAVKAKLKTINKKLVKTVLFPEFGPGARMPEVGGEKTCKFSMETKFQIQAKDSMGFAVDFSALNSWTPLVLIYNTQKNKRWNLSSVVRSDGAIYDVEGGFQFTDEGGDELFDGQKFMVVNYTDPPLENTNYKFFKKARLIGASINILPIDVSSVRGRFKGGLVDTTGLVYLNETPGSFGSIGLSFIYFLQSLRLGYLATQGTRVTPLRKTTYVTSVKKILDEQIDYSFVTGRNVAEAMLRGGEYLFTIKGAEDNPVGDQGVNVDGEANPISESIFKGITEFIKTNGEKYLSTNFGRFAYDKVSIDDKVLEHTNLYHEEYAINGFRVLAPMTADRKFFYPYETDCRKTGPTPHGIIKYEHPTPQGAGDGVLNSFGFEIQIIRHFEGIPTDDLEGILVPKKSLYGPQSYDFLTYLPNSVPRVFTITPGQTRATYEKLRGKFTFLHTLDENEFHAMLGIDKPPNYGDFDEQGAGAHFTDQGIY